MTNYERYFGTPERAAKSIKSFISCDAFRASARESYGDWICKNYDNLKEDMPLILMWLKDEADA